MELNSTKTVVLRKKLRSNDMEMNWLGLIGWQVLVERKNKFETPIVYESIKSYRIRKVSASIG